MARALAIGLMTFAMASGAVSISAKEQAKDGSQGEKPKLICKTEKAIGSLTRRNRVCLTKEEWQEVNDATRDGVGGMQSRSTMANNISGDAAMAGGT